MLLQGEKEKNIEDVHDFSLILPTLEYHNCIWTWFDLLMAMKNDSKRVLIAQVTFILFKTISYKLFRKVIIKVHKYSFNC